MFERRRCLNVSEDATKISQCYETIPTFACIKRRRRRLIVCDSLRSRLTASVLTLLKSINARCLIPYRPHVRTLPKVLGSSRMSSMTVDGTGRHANASEGISENAKLILDCWHAAQRFGTVLYRIVSWYFVQYRIVSIVFPHSYIVTV